jgi:hypothetical protein
VTGDDPKPKAYRPFVAARYPADGRPATKPAWRVLVHRKHVREWNRLSQRCGESNARELWDHLTTRPNREPLLGAVTPMKGRQHGPTGDGMSRVYHYEITGGGRVDYRYNPQYRVGGGDPHPVVQIVSISLGSH